MQNPLDEQIKRELIGEIQQLEENYKTIRSYLSGVEYEPTEIQVALKKLRDTLSVVSAHILTLYNLKGQKIRNIPWEPLFTNIDYALATMAITQKTNARMAVKLALTISDPKIDEVMLYLTNLRESLK